MSTGYSKGTGLGAEIIGTFVLCYTVFSATDPKRNARDSHIPVIKIYSLFLNFDNLKSYWQNFEFEVEIGMWSCTILYFKDW